MGISALLEEWDERLLIAGKVHYAFSQRLLTRSRWVDGGIVAITLVAAATAFSAPFPPGLNGLIAGLLSASGAVGTLLASVWNPAGRSVQHRETGALYFALRRDLEIVSSTRTEGDASEALSGIKGRYDDLSRSAPLPSQRLYTRIRKRIKEDRKQRQSGAQANIVQPEESGGTYE